MLWTQAQDTMTTRPFTSPFGECRAIHEPNSGRAVVVIYDHFTNYGVREELDGLSGAGFGKHVNVPGVVLGDDIAAGHAVSAVVACRTGPGSDGPRRFTDGDYLYAQLFRSLLDDPVTAAQWCCGQKLAVGQVF